MEGQDTPTNPPPLTESTGRAVGSAGRALARIPGLPEEGERRFFVIDGAKKTVADLLAECRSSQGNQRHEALTILSQTRHLNRSDLYLATSTLLALGLEDPHNDHAEVTALVALLENHLPTPEAIFFALQALRIFTEGGASHLQLHGFANSVHAAIGGIRLSAQPSRREMTELKHLLVKALELPKLRGVTAIAIKLVLEESSKEGRVLRQDFANNLLAFLRLNADCATITSEQGVIDLKRLATTVFTTGFAPPAFTAGTKPPPMPGKQALTADSGSRAAWQLPTSRNIRASDVIRRLMNDDTNAVAMRLSPEELHILRQVDGLALDEFKSITQQLRARAIQDMWARAAVLDIVRAKHADEVTAQIRTGVLGALISEARKLGRLTNQLEKEVFAVSAEIPSLSFLAREEGNGHEAPPPAPPPIPTHP